MGIYLGACMGLGFWTKLDPAGQDAAVVFPTCEEAESFMATWDDGKPVGVTLHTITPDVDNGAFASIDACVAAGLEGWDPAGPKWDPHGPAEETSITPNNAA
jgi:hypothetical protein